LGCRFFSNGFYYKINYRYFLEMENLKATDLRIGNLIKREASREIHRGSIRNYVVSETYEEIIIVNPETIYTFNNYFYSGIPLTEEWLLKFGFGKAIGYFIPTFPNISLEVSENTDNATGQWYCYIRNLNSVSRHNDDFALLRKDLRYVHQLQNLYFALTGQELTLKE
jgi:hypothetical protein